MAEGKRKLNEYFGLASESTKRRTRVPTTVSATGQYLSAMPLLKFGIVVQFVIANIYGVLAGVAVEELVGYGKTLRGECQSNQDLQSIRTVITGVTVPWPKEPLRGFCRPCRP